MKDTLARRSGGRYAGPPATWSRGRTGRGRSACRGLPPPVPVAAVQAEWGGGEGGPVDLEEQHSTHRAHKQWSFVTMGHSLDPLSLLCSSRRDLTLS